MLPQFKLISTGSLVSELLTIYQGKFVVRVSVQVEGVTRYRQQQKHQNWQKTSRESGTEL